MTAHPLRPVILALSLRLNGPAGLLAEIESIGAVDQGEHARLAALALQAGTLLAKAAIALEEAEDAVRLVETDEFRAMMAGAGSALSSVATAKWPKEPEGEDWQVLWKAERKLRKACLDMGTGCFSLSSGRLPRPDRRNLLTNITKAIPRELDHVSWTFHTLPDYGSDAPGPSAVPGRVSGAGA